MKTNREIQEDMSDVSGDLATQDSLLRVLNALGRRVTESWNSDSDWESDWNVLQYDDTNPREEGNIVSDSGDNVVEFRPGPYYIDEMRQLFSMSSYSDYAETEDHLVAWNDINWGNNDENRYLTAIYAFNKKTFHLEYVQQVSFEPDVLFDTSFSGLLDSEDGDDEVFAIGNHGGVMRIDVRTGSTVEILSDIDTEEGNISNVQSGTHIPDRDILAYVSSNNNHLYLVDLDAGELIDIYYYEDNTGSNFIESQDNCLDHAGDYLIAPLSGDDGTFVRVDLDTFDKEIIDIADELELETVPSNSFWAWAYHEGSQTVFTTDNSREMEPLWAFDPIDLELKQEEDVMPWSTSNVDREAVVVEGMYDDDYYFATVRQSSDSDYYACRFIIDEDNGTVELDIAVNHDDDRYWGGQWNDLRRNDFLSVTDDGLLVMQGTLANIDMLPYDEYVHINDNRIDFSNNKLEETQGHTLSSSPDGACAFVQTDDKREIWTGEDRDHFLVQDMDGGGVVFATETGMRSMSMRYPEHTHSDYVVALNGSRSMMVFERDTYDYYSADDNEFSTNVEYGVPGPDYFWGVSYDPEWEEEDGTYIARWSWHKFEDRSEDMPDPDDYVWLRDTQPNNDTNDYRYAQRPVITEDYFFWMDGNDSNIYSVTTDTFEYEEIDIGSTPSNNDFIEYDPSENNLWYMNSGLIGIVDIDNDFEIEDLYDMQYEDNECDLAIGKDYAYVIQRNMWVTTINKETMETYENALNRYDPDENERDYPDQAIYDWENEQLIITQRDSHFDNNGYPTVSVMRTRPNNYFWMTGGYTSESKDEWESANYRLLGGEENEIEISLMSSNYPLDDGKKEVIEPGDDISALDAQERYRFSVVIELNDPLERTGIESANISWLE